MTIKLVFPESTTNLISNPSMEIDTTGWAAINGATIARSTTKQSRGVASLSISGANVNAGADYARASLVNGETYTESIDFYGVDGIPYTLELRDGVGAIDSENVTGSGRWIRYTLSGVLANGTTATLRARKNNHADAGAFYVDGVQMEKKAYATSYIDGDQPGGTWASTAHGSSSSRDGRDKRGGKEQDVVTDLGFSDVLEPLQGFGMPPIGHLDDKQAGLDGSTSQGQKILDRPMSMTLNIDLSEFSTEATKLNGYALKRKKLIDAFNPFKGLSREQATRLIYNALPTELEIDTEYVSGLQGPYGIVEVANKQPTVQMIARDPLWRERFDVGKSLPSKESVSVKCWAGYQDGDWSSISEPSSVSTGIGLSAQVWDVKIGDNGKIYLCGDFTNFDGIANADYFVVYDPATGVYSAAGTGLNSTARQMVKLANGTILVVGDFTATGDGLTTLRRWAIWNPNTSTWSEPNGWGFNGAVHSVAIARSGNYYFCGDFTEIGTGSGPVAATRVARLATDGTKSALGTGLNDTGHRIAIHPDNKVYVAGIFTSAGGVANTGGIAYWSGSDWVSVGGGLSSVVVTAQHRVAISPAGLVYFGGFFTSIGNPAVTANHIAKWNGAAWSALGSGFNAGVRGITVLTEDRVFLVGNFSIADGQNLLGAGITAWNGTTFDLSAGAGFPTSYSVNHLEPISATSYYLGTAGNATATSQSKTVVNNPGSAESQPKMRIKRSGGTSAKLRTIKNTTSGAELDFDYSIADGETILIDFGAGTIVSSLRGSILDELLSGVGLAAFALLPGDNSISVLVEDAGSPTISVEMWWRPRHLSIDGVAA
ncbi:MAG: phage tail family protein [Phycisphaerales bacterium]|nr:phage tail family protein [Phycisphaerales bacterium]